MKTILGGGKKKGSSRTKTSSSSSKDAKAKALIGKTIEVKNRRFKVKEILGEGGYSNVYRVVEEGSNNVFALKRMLVSADEMDLVKREVSLMKSIPPHRNLVHFECANVTTSAEQRKGEDLMEANIIMEYADVRLFDVMEARHTEGKYFTEAELIAIMVDVCEGVAVLHQHRPPIAHRDIKVENVLLGNDGAYKLCDFGSATSVTHHPKTAAERDAAEADIERNTTMVYRAPEMLDLYAAKPIDEKADIWALGCMLYKMCFFEDAFSIGGRLAILQANFSFPLAPKYSPELNECIKYMLELNAEERPSITAVIRRLQRLKAGLGQDTPGKHRRSRTWGGSQDNLHLDDIPPAAANAEDKATSLHSSGASSNRERRKIPVVPRKTSSDLDTSFAASPPSPATEHKSSLRDSRRPRRESGHGRRELHFDGPTAGSGATNGGIDPNPNSRGSPVSDRAFAFPAPPSHHRKGSISASASPLLRPDTFPSPVLSPSSALKPGQLMPGGSPMMGMMSITPLGSGGTASLPHGLGGLSMVPLGSGGGSPSGGLTLTALPSGGNQGGLTLTPIPSGGGGGGFTMTPLASGGNPGAGAGHHGGLTLSPLASGGGNQGQQGGLTMAALASGGNNHGGGGGLTMTPLVSGSGGLSMTPLASGGNQGGLTMTPLISGGGGGGGGGLTMTPLASGGNQGGLAMTPLASGGLTMTALASGGNQGGLTLAQRNSGGLTMNPLTSGGGNQGHGGLTMAPLTSGGKTGIPTPYSSAASNGYHNLSPLASGEGAMGMSIKPLASGGTTRGPTTPTRAGAISKSSGGSGSGSGGGEMSIIPTISGSSRDKEGKGEIITFEAMMKLIDREREEKDKRSHSVDSIESDVRGEGQEQGGRKPTTGSSKKKKNKKTRREILPGGTISSSDEDGLNMLASSEHDYASEGNKPEQTKLKKLRKSLQMKEKGFKEIRSQESVDDTATTGGAKEKKANRKSKLFGKLGIEYAGEGPIDTDAGSHPDDEMSPFGVASSPTIPLSVALASTSKESKQAQFMNADIPLHQSFLKHNFDLDFVYTAEYLARKALAHGHRMWALAPADTPIDDVKIWAANGVTDSYFAHIKSRKLGNSYEECLRCLLSLFKMLQEGSPCVLLECYQHLAWLQNLRKTAKMQEKAQLVQLMCTFLVKKIEFHRHHPQFEGTYSLQTHHAQKRQRSEQYAVDQAGSFQELEDLLGVQQALMDIPNLILMQLDTYKDDLALEALPLLVAESHAILSMSTYLLVKLKVFCFDKDKLGTFQELKGSYKALYYVLSRFYSQILHYTNISPSLVPGLPPKQKISALLNVQVLQYPVSYNPHFAQVRLKTLSRELPKVAGQMQHHDKEREKKERREREKREKDEKKREKERSKLEKKREKGMKKGMRLPGKKIGKADLKKELKREMQKEWEEELERESVRGRDTRPSVAEASSMIPASPPPAEAITTSNVEPLHSSVQRPVARRRLEPSMSSGAFQPPHQPQHPPHVHILGEEGRTVSLVEVPAITLQPEPEPHHSPLKRTHSRSKSYAGHEKVQINEFDVSRLISQQHPVYANASWNPFS